MKKIFTILAVAVTSLMMENLAYGENYFREGMRWEFESEVDINGKPFPFSSTYWLEGTRDVAGEEGMLLWNRVEGHPLMGDATILVNVLKSEGDKVYFLLTNESTEWSLLYDFSIGKDELFTVYSPDFFWNDTDPKDIDQKPYEMKCLGTGEIVSAGKTLKTFSIVDETNLNAVEADPATYSFFVKKWIDGIGCECGVIDNSRYGMPGAGISKLIKATLNGDVIYEAESSGVSQIDNKEEADLPMVNLQGLPVDDHYKGIVVKKGRKQILR